MGGKIMVKTLASIFISLALIVGISAYDIYTVGKTFDTFTAALEALYDKTENKTATYEDGKAIRTFWKDKKKGASRLDSSCQHRKYRLSTQRSSGISL